MHNETVQQPITTVFTNLNPTIMMLRGEGEFVSKYNVVSLILLSMSAVHHTIDGANSYDFQSLAAILPQSKSESWSNEFQCLPRGMSKYQRHEKNNCRSSNHQSAISKYITLVGGTTVVRDVRLSYNPDHFNISSPPKHDVNYHIVRMLPSGKLGSIFGGQKYKKNVLELCQLNNKQ
ncbi:hypothetical protein TNCV_256551 [Trichonephila clavipes]|nr:hypothetical protein TNCV_256551 [Trichonephila clavipes]